MGVILASKIIKSIKRSRNNRYKNSRDFDISDSTEIGNEVCDANILGGDIIRKEG